MEDVEDGEDAEDVEDGEGAVRKYDSGCGGC